MRKPFLFFDLDNTLLDFTWAEKRALSRAFREVGLEPTPEILERYRVINIRQWELLENGILTREQVLLSRYEILFREFSIQASAKAVGDRYEELLQDGYRFIPGAQELLDLCGIGRAYISFPTAVPRCRLRGLPAPGSGRVLKESLSRRIWGLTNRHQPIFIVA